MDSIGGLSWVWLVVYEVTGAVEITDQTGRDAHIQMIVNQGSEICIACKTIFEIAKDSSCT